MNSRLTTAVIMAAGMGTRFGKMTETMPKGFVECGGEAMVVRSIETLLACGMQRIVIGTGYRHEAYQRLAARFPQIECVHSPRYAETNSMYTLYNCRQAIGTDDFLLLESDIIFGRNAIEHLLDDAHPDTMLITPVTKFQDQYYVECNAEGTLTRCSTVPTEVDARGELVGIHKLSSAFYASMCDAYAQIADAQPKMGYEYQLLWMSQHVRPVYVLCAHDVHWYEIDDERDLAYAEEHVVPRL